MMASLPLLNKHMFLKGGPPSESQSEISSVESDFSDLKSIAAQLGVANADDLYMERFKIDRTKLEDMIRAESYSEGMNKAEYFFVNLMKETNTHISWPCRLKIGAKTKKDPHVRIVGKQEDVLRSKDRIMACLDSKGNRVIMKMDVSYTDHSYIIGRGGNNIKRIMDETQTHIHFPDSNRSNPTEKSNQVSLCGTLEGVEKARTLVRQSTPLLISFELPVYAPGQPVPDSNTPFIKEIEKNHNVQVIFSTRPKLHSSMVLVKGCEKDHANVKEATKLLIEYMFESIAGQIPVQMHLEISTQHHPVVLGKNSMNLREIMGRTATKIIFPDANDTNIKPIKRSQVTITGSINGVYMARQQLLGNLPIALIFDYPENQIDSEHITKLMYANDVFITVRQKSRQSTLCIVIKGIEKFIANIYEARYQLLKLSCPKIEPDIPSTYYGPNDKFKNNSMTSLLAGPSPFSPLSPVRTLPYVAWPSSPNADIQMSLRNRMQNLQINPNHINSANALSPLTASMLNQHNQLNNLQVPGHMNNKINLCDMHSSSGYNSFSNDSIMDKNQSIRTLPSTSSGLFGSNSNHSSPENSVNYGNKFAPPGIHFESPPFNQKGNFVPDRRTSLNDSLMFNFDPRIVAGYRAMNISPQQGEARIPTPIWQGAGLSRTSPSPLESSNNNNNNSQWLEQQQHYDLLNMTTSLLDSTPVRQRNHLSKYNDITSLLTCLGLENHIQHFINGEIDMTVFPTLTETDLMNLGIKPLGARRRIMMAVHDMSSRQNISMAFNAYQQHNQQQTQQSQQQAAAASMHQQVQAQAQAQIQEASKSSPPTPLRFSGSAAPGDERRSSSGN